MGKHYWKEILPKVLEMEGQGYTHRMVADELGYSRDQIKELVKRYRRKQRKAPYAAKARKQAEDRFFRKFEEDLKQNPDA